MSETTINASSNQQLITEFQQIVGRNNVLTSKSKTARFRKGYRSGEGDALAVVRPSSLLEMWQLLQAAFAAQKIIIMQAANTGLTEGSTPKGTYDRDVVIINTMKLDGIHLIQKGEQIVSLPGATLFELEKQLAPINRAPHSVIGSSCIGASIVGGVCNNSGGALVERGPAYTELSLYAQINLNGELELVNHLGIELGGSPDEMLTRLESGDFGEMLTDSNQKASATDYERIVRDLDAPTPARYNADKTKLYESSGCAGKLAVFAVRLDTYPKADKETTFYIGTNHTAELTLLRRKLLSDVSPLPVSGEYMHRDVFDLSVKYGKDTIIMIDKLGTDKLPSFFALKGRADSLFAKVPFMKHFTDYFMQGVSALWPDNVPKVLRDYRDKYEHMLILKVKDEGIDATREVLDTLQLDYHECTPRETKIAGLIRFAAAGCAIRYANLHSNAIADLSALDIALRRNDEEWFEQLPAELAEQCSHRLYYGHFFCHVMHQDYLLKKGVDAEQFKTDLLKTLDARGAIYPAEHNVGHLYQAGEDQIKFFKTIDPTNSLNPGIGKTSRRWKYQ